MEQIPGVKRFDVDDFQELARVNNEKKQHEVQAADQILAEIQKDLNAGWYSSYPAEDRAVEETDAGRGREKRI